MMGSSVKRAIVNCFLFLLAISFFILWCNESQALKEEIKRRAQISSTSIDLDARLLEFSRWDTDSLSEGLRESFESLMSVRAFFLLRILYLEQLSGDSQFESAKQCHVGCLLRVLDIRSALQFRNSVRKIFPDSRRELTDEELGVVGEVLKRFHGGGG
jgi:hypothetical protein